jgi:amidohydrolase
MPLGAGFVTAPAAEIPDARLKEAAGRHAPAAVADRRWFHEHPELGNRESETAARVAATLQSIGLKVERPAGPPAVLGLLDTGKPGPVVAIRAEMDALPVQEAEDSGNPIRSRNAGVMHACGHDVHMASALGAARILKEVAADLQGKILFIFQPAEEGVAPPEREALKKATGSDLVGADRLVKLDRVLEKHGAKAIFGLHGFPESGAGIVGLAPEYALAAADAFEIVIRGRSAHAGQSPWTGSDVLHIAAGVVLDLHALPARQSDPRIPKVVSVSMLECTDGRVNILCRTARLSGTVRTFRAEDRRDLKDGIERIFDAAVKARDPQAGRCRAGDAADRLCWDAERYDQDGLPVRQDASLLEWSSKILEPAFGADSVKRVPASLGAEDYAAYCEQVPCVFLFLGTAPPGGTGGLHTPRYAPSEEALPVGMRALATLAARYLTRPRVP